MRKVCTLLTHARSLSQRGGLSTIGEGYLYLTNSNLAYAAAWSPFPILRSAHFVNDGSALAKNGKGANFAHYSRVRVLSFPIRVF